MTFVDESRPTAAAGDQPAQPTRTIVTDLWYPAAGDAEGAERPEAPLADGPFPLFVFSHGQSAQPQQYAPSFHAWARAGYVVAAPRHPLTVGGTPMPTISGDIFEQPADVSFVITQLGEEEDLVDVDHVAAGGHSSGAVTALAAGANTCCDDDRIDALVLEAVLPVDFEDGRYFDEDLPDVPVLFLHGDADPSIPIADAHTLFEDADPPKFFVTIKGGGHSDPYRAGPPDPTMVIEVVTDFLDRYVKERDDALGEMRETVRRTPIGGLEAVPED